MSAFEREAVELGKRAATESNDPKCPHERHSWLANAWRRGLSEELERIAKASTAPRARN